MRTIAPACSDRSAINVGLVNSEHEMVGTVAAIGAGHGFEPGDRVGGVGWAYRLGHRTLTIAGDAKRIGILGFNATAYIDDGSIAELLTTPKRTRAACS